MRSMWATWAKHLCETQTPVGRKIRGSSDNACRSRKRAILGPRNWNLSSHWNGSSFDFFFFLFFFPPANARRQKYVYSMRGARCCRARLADHLHLHEKLREKRIRAVCTRAGRDGRVLSKEATDELKQPETTIHYDLAGFVGRGGRSRGGVSSHNELNAQTLAARVASGVQRHRAVFWHTILRVIPMRTVWLTRV